MEDFNLVDRHILSEIVEGDVELLPLISADEENEMNKQTIPDVLPYSSVEEYSIISRSNYSNYSRKR